MTDTTIQPPVKRGSLGKASVSGIYLMICQNITPPLVGYFCAQFPLLKEDVWFQIVVLCLGGIGSFLVWLTPQHANAAIKNMLISIKTTLKEWRDAWNSIPP